MVSGILGAILACLFGLIVPNIETNGLTFLFMLCAISSVMSGLYTHYLSGGLPRGTQEDMLSQLRDGVDPSLVCPSCNIIQSRAVHCNVCNTCVADPHCQHSYLVSTCITSRNRNSFIWLIGSLLTLDLVLLMISVSNFKLEIVPGLQSGFDGPFNLAICAVFVLSISTILPLL